MIERTTCRHCAGELGSILNLGAIYPSNFVTETKGSPEPLHLVECLGCGLVQLKHTVDLDSMYRRYWYRSGINQTMVKALNDIINGIKERIDFKQGDIVVDIGCNDGTLLALMPEYVFKVGFDPAYNLAKTAKGNCNLFINDYFTADKYHVIDRAKIVTSIAMFYDLEYPNKFIKDVKAILHPDGIWIIQFTDLLSMLKLNAFDNICHEHLEYYSLRVLVDMLYKYELDVFDVEYNSVNGGSLRAYVCHQDSRRIRNEVVYALREERKYLDSFDDPLKAFAERVQRAKIDLKTYLRMARERGKRIYALGASTKGNTLLQYFNIGPDMIQAIGEVNRSKIGLKTVGSNIPIISEAQAYNDRPDGIVILPWHFKDHFVNNSKQYLDRGGHLVFPLPELEIVTSDRL